MKFELTKNNKENLFWFITGVVGASIIDLIFEKRTEKLCMEEFKSKNDEIKMLKNKLNKLGEA